MHSYSTYKVAAISGVKYWSCAFEVSSIYPFSKTLFLRLRRLFFLLLFVLLDGCSNEFSLTMLRKKVKEVPTTVIYDDLVDWNCVFVDHSEELIEIVKKYGLLYLFAFWLH